MKLTDYHKISHFLMDSLKPKVLFQVTYHELETFNDEDGESSSFLVSDTKFSMDQLQPGRNYSIAVSAVSNNTKSIALHYSCTGLYIAGI